jgi:hypothetical protein
MEKKMDDLAKARITVPGALYVAAIAVCIVVQTDVLSRSEPEVLKAVVALLGGGALLVASGQIISAVTTVVLFVAFHATRKCFDFYDTFYIDVQAARSDPRLTKYLKQLRTDLDVRLILNFLSQIELTHNKEIQGWVSRRWYAANVYLGCAVASILALATSCFAFASHPPGWLLGALGATALFTGTLGLIHRYEVVWMVKFVLDNPFPRQEPNAKTNETSPIHDES